MEPVRRRWHTREDSGIVLDRHGRWWHDGEPIEHPRIIQAFNQGLIPADGGRFKLQFGRDWCFVDVEDAAYQVESAQVCPSEILLHLSDGSEEVLDVPTLQLDAEGVLFCQVKTRKAKARMTRAAQFTVGACLENDGRGWSLRLGETVHPLDLGAPVESSG
jgi:uncharacterized protein